MAESGYASEVFLTDGLDNFEPVGVISYAPLMRKLEQEGYAEEDKKQLPMG